MFTPQRSLLLSCPWPLRLSPSDEGIMKLDRYKMRHDRLRVEDFAHIHSSPEYQPSSIASQLCSSLLGSILNHRRHEDHSRPARLGAPIRHYLILAHQQRHRAVRCLRRHEARHGHTPRGRRPRRDPRLRRAPTGSVFQPHPETQVLARPKRRLLSRLLLQALWRRRRVVLDCPQ